MISYSSLILVFHDLCLQAYYSSVSGGYSISEAVAFAPPDWVVLGSKRYKVSSVRLFDNEIRTDSVPSSK